MLEVKEISKRFYKGKAKKETLVLKDINFSMHEGEIFGVVGESGSGKSTLARILAGLIRPDSGKVYFQKRELVNSRKVLNNDFRLKLQMVFQQPALALDPKQKIADAIAEPLLYHRLAVSKKRVSDKVAELLEMTSLHAEILNRLPSQISGGQAQRVVIARALALEPRFIIADEPTSMLDISVQAQIIRLLGQLRETKGIGIIFISHDTKLVNAFCDRIGFLSGGILNTQ